MKEKNDRTIILDKSSNFENLSNAVIDCLQLCDNINRVINDTTIPIKEAITISVNINNIMKDMINDLNLQLNEITKSSIISELHDAITKFIRLSLENANSSNLTLEQCNQEVYTSEIIEQLSDDVEPTEIAQNLEKKTNIKWEVWIPIIIGILQLIWNVYNDINSKPQIINNNNYIIVESHKKEIDEYEKRLDQIDNDMSNKMNNDRNSQK